MAQVYGYELVARTLKQLDVKNVFSVPGAPVLEILAASAKEGVRPIGVHSEQSGVVMAVAENYVAGRIVAVPALTSGPGVTNGVTGALIAHDNCWPLVVLGGRQPVNMAGMDTFEELDAVPIYQSITKWSVQVQSTARLPEHITRAFQIAMIGRPGPVYLELPWDVLTRAVDENIVVAPPYQPPPLISPDPRLISQAAELLLKAERPVVIIGKGIRWSGAWKELTTLVDRLQLPFVTSPMGRGYIPDDHPLCFQAARNTALKNADVVLIIGARFNWMFRFGAELDPGAKVIQVDVEPREIGHNRRADVGIAGDAKLVVSQLLEELGGSNVDRMERAGDSPWIAMLQAKRVENEAMLEPFLNSTVAPMATHRMLKEIREVLPRDAICTVDGQMILGASRQTLPAYFPASRLDSGSNGCMGTGVPFAIGAKLACPDRPVVSLVGDCSFSYNAMEMETALRHNIPVIFVVEENEGITGHMLERQLMPDHPERLMTYLPNVRYDKIMEAFGGHTEYVERPEELKPALHRAFAAGVAACINVKANPMTPYPGPEGQPRRATIMMQY